MVFVRDPSGPFARAAALALALCAAAPAGALAFDRVAIEVRAGESPQEATLAFERACWRLGAAFQAVTPAQVFSFEGATFVRLRVDGTPLVQRCLEELEQPRRAVDGTIAWFDGFEGGLLVPASEPPVRVPDAVWYDPAATPPPAPALDPAIPARAAEGDVEALAAIAKLELGPALAAVDSLGGKGAGALAALETIAKAHPHWRVRRAAVESLDPAVSFEVVKHVAANDAAWEVRAGAVELIGLAGGSPLAMMQPRSQDAAQALVARVRDDAAWEVRRTALWQLSSAVVSSNRELVSKVAAADPEPRVRAVAIEALAGAGALTRKDALRYLEDASPGPRATAAAALVDLMEPADAPALWAAMNARERLVRLASAGLLERIDDPTLGPALWPLYVLEADQVDSNESYLRLLADTLARHPYGGLAAQVEERLSLTLAPPERRVLARLLARIAPARASALFEPLLSDADAERRAFAAEVVPHTAATRARRLELLEDPDPDVRAAAVLGLCGGTDPSVKEQASRAELERSGAGLEASIALRHCAQPAPELPRMTTRLLDPVDDEARRREAGFWPAVAGILLLLASVVAIKLARPPPEPIPPATTPSAPPPSDEA